MKVVNLDLNAIKEKLNAKQMSISNGGHGLVADLSYRGKKLRVKYTDGTIEVYEDPEVLLNSLADVSSSNYPLEDIKLDSISNGSSTTDAVVLDCDGLTTQQGAVQTSFESEQSVLLKPMVVQCGADQEGVRTDSSILSYSQILGLGLLGFLGVGGATAMAISSSHGDDSSQGASTPETSTPETSTPETSTPETSTPDNFVGVTTNAGPVVPENDLMIKVFDLFGNEIASGTTQTGNISFNVGSYTGGLIVKVFGGTAQPDFWDEATNTPKAMNAVLMGLGVLPGGTVMINVNPITTVAAVKAGLNVADGSGEVVGNGVAEKLATIAQSNSQVAQAFGLSGELSQIEAVTIVKSDGSSNTDNANDLGRILAAISGVDLLNGGEMSETILRLTDGVVNRGSDWLLAPDVQSTIFEGAAVFGSVDFGMFGTPYSFTVTHEMVASAANGDLVINGTVQNSLNIVNGSWTVQPIQAINGISYVVYSDGAGHALKVQSGVLVSFPPISGVVLSADTGVSTSDFVTQTASQTITATLSSSLDAGGKAWGSLDGGVSWIDITSKVSGTSLNWDGVTLAGSGGTLKLKISDAAGNDSLAYSQAYDLDTTAPTHAFGTVSLSADTGVSTSDFVTQTASQTITATLSSSLDAGGKAWGSLDGGVSWIDITSKVSGTSLNWDGVTLAGSGGTLKLKISDAAGNDSLAYSQAYDLDTTAPTHAFGTVSLSADTGVSTSDFVTQTASQTITATLSSSLDAGGKAWGSLDGGVSWIDITSKVSGTSLNWDGVTLAGSGGTLKLKISDAAGNDSLAYSQAYDLDTTAPTHAFGTVSLSADTGVSTSDFVTQTASQTITATLSSSLDAGGKAWGSLDGGVSWIDITSKVSGTSLNWDGVTLAGSGGTLKLKISDAAGNDSLAYSQAYDLDTMAPIAPTLVSLSADTGVSTSDFVTQTASQTITATLSSSLDAGGKAWGSLDGGVSWIDITSKVSGTSLNWDGVTLAGSGGTLKLKISDAAGNDSLAYSQAYDLDTTAPTHAFGTVSLSADTGVSTSDFVTQTASQTITATLSSSLDAGGKAWGSLDGGVSWIDITSKVSGTSLNWDGVTLAGSGGTLKLKISDAAGNDSLAYSQAYDLDTTAPTHAFGTVSLSADTGVSTSDFVTQTASQTITATLSSSLDAGGKAWGSLDGGVSWIDITSKVSGTSLNWDGVTLAGSGGTLKLKISDAAGNDSLAYSQAYDLDTMAPIAPTLVSLSADTGVSTSDFITQTASQTITATLSSSLDAGGKAWGSLDGGVSWIDITSKVSGTSLNWDGVTLAGSGGTLKLKISDAAGNDSLAYSQAYDLDTTAPTHAFGTVSLSADTGVSTSDFVTQTASQTITATLSSSLDAGGKAWGSLDGGVSWIDITSKVSGTSLNWDGVTLAGSGGTLKLKISDAAGNDSLAYSQAYDLDTTAPTHAFGTVSLSADTGVSTSDFVTQTASQTITATLSSSLDAGGKAWGSLDGGVSWIDITSKVSGTSLNWDGVTLAGSGGTLKLKISDAAGNDSLAYSQAYDLDTTAPTHAFGTVSLSADTGVSTSDFVTQTASQTITATLSSSLDAGGKAWGSLDGGVSWIDITSKVSGTSLNWDGVTLAGSGGTLKLKISDAAGNDSLAYSQAYDLDTMAPIAPTLVSLSADTGVSTSDFITQTASQTITATLSSSLDAGGKAWGSLDGGVSWIDITSKVSGTSLNWDGVTLAGSGGTLKLKISDAAGNDSLAYSQAYDLDTTAPIAPTLALALDTGPNFFDGITDNAVINVSGLDSAIGASWEYQVDGGVWRTGVASKFMASTGTHTYNVRQNDLAGNVSGVSPLLSVSYAPVLNLSTISTGVGGFVINGQCASDQSGYSVSGAGDVNGDGLADLIVGAPQSDPQSVLDAGRSYVVFGQTGTTAINLSAVASGNGGFVINGRSTNDTCGMSVGDAGDVNGDGLADLIVGASGAFASLGESYVVFGKSDSIAIDLSAVASNMGGGFVIKGACTGDQSGLSVSGVGDVNGDGFADLIIGAYGSDPASRANAGCSYVVFGKSSDVSPIDLSQIANNAGGGFVIKGRCGNENSGFSVSGAGDVNGDGLADLLVGAYSANSNTGYSYVVFGKPTEFAINLSDVALGIGGFVINGNSAGDQSGYSVSGAGDVNGDGRADIIVGAKGANSGNGKSYVVFGKPTGTAINLSAVDSEVGGFVINGQCMSGYSVSDAGDMNGDGLADLIVGAIGAGSTGQSYVVFGKTGTTPIDLSAVASGAGGFVIKGECSGDYAGASVSSAGDVNGDGLSDLIVGAYYSDPSAVMAAGRSYVIFGDVSGVFGETYVDQLGMGGSNTLTSTGKQTLVGGAGDDVLVSHSGDVLYGGSGNDIFVVNSSMANGLEMVFGSGGNLGQMSMINGGTGLDVIRLVGGSTINLSLVSYGRITSIEKIDLRTDTASNTLGLKALDIIDMTEMNVFNDTMLGGNALGANVAKHQILIDAASGDTVQIDASGWTDTGTFVTANGHSYEIYNHTSAVQLLIDDLAIVSKVL